MAWTSLSIPTKIKDWAEVTPATQYPILRIDFTESNTPDKLSGFYTNNEIKYTLNYSEYYANYFLLQQMFNFFIQGGREVSPYMFFDYIGDRTIGHTNSLYIITKSHVIDINTPNRYVSHNPVELYYDYTEIPDTTINKVRQRCLVDFYPSYLNPICTMIVESDIQWNTNIGTVISDYATRDFNNDFSLEFNSVQTFTRSRYSKDIVFNRNWGNIAMADGSWHKNRVDGCKYPYCLLYINKAGGWEMLPLVGRGIATYAKKSIRQNSTGQWWMNVNTEAVTSVDVSNEISTSLQFYLPFIRSSRTKYLGDILFSPNCYLVDGEKQYIYTCTIDELDEANMNTYNANYKVTLTFDKHITNIR